MMATTLHAGPGAPDAEAPPMEEERSTALQPFMAPQAPVVRETSATAVAAREKAAVEARYIVALNRPRDFQTCRLRLLDACKRPKFAGAARYSKPVGTQKVVGFSIRFAEEARTLWGNLDVSSFLVVDDDLQRIYRVTATDLETNATEGIDIAVEKFVERRQVRQGQEVMSSRLNSQNQKVYRIRATEDDLIVKVNALISKARRNLILALMPADVKEECEEQVMRTLRDRDSQDPEGAVKEICNAFWTLGVTPDQVRSLAGGKDLKQLNPAEIGLLRTVYVAIRDGEATYDDALAEVQGKASGTSTPAETRTDLEAKLARKKAEVKAEKEAAKAAKPDPAGRTADDDALDLKLAEE